MNSIFISRFFLFSLKLLFVDARKITNVLNIPHLEKDIEVDYNVFLTASDKLFIKKFKLLQLFRGSLKIKTSLCPRPTLFRLTDRRCFFMN